MEVAKVVVRWRGPDYEGAGGVKADGLAVVLHWCSRVTESEDMMWGIMTSHGTSRDR